MTEVVGELPDRYPALEHVSGVGVTQGMNAEFLMTFHQPAFGLGPLEGILDGGAAHVIGMSTEGLAKSQTGVLPFAPHTGKEPFEIAMAFPEETQPVEQFSSDRYLPLFAALAVDDANGEAFSVDVLGFDGEGFAHAQTTQVDDGEIGSVTAIAKGGEETGDLFPGEQVGKRFVTFDFDILPDGPILAEVIAIKGAQSGDRLID